MAKQLDQPKLWQRLGSEALAHGSHRIVEMTYQKLRSFDKLSFLYIVTGDKEKLQRMAKIAEHMVGAINFAPLEGRFLEIYAASRTFLPANAGMPPLVKFVRRTINETDSRKTLPIVPRDLESVVSGEMTQGKNAMKFNKPEDGLAAFQKALRLLMVNVTTSQSAVQEARQAIRLANVTPRGL
ncbi:hypothetical protein LTR49_022151 [Elasticomyces elasticus]|nr:hypothetical protein LTR49_022151 [Elasticomyces elasticus]